MMSQSLMESDWPVEAFPVAFVDLYLRKMLGPSEAVLAPSSASPSSSLNADSESEETTALHRPSR